jgi:hypothetical protein
MRIAKRGPYLKKQSPVNEDSKGHIYETYPDTEHSHQLEERQNLLAPYFQLLCEHGRPYRQRCHMSKLLR